MGFARVKQILEDSIAAWTSKNGNKPDLTGHGPTFLWNTKQELLAAVGHGKRLIPPEMIGNNNGKKTNLIIDLRTGIIPPLRMPLDGPFIPDDQIQEIEDWIDAGCPD